MVYKLQTRVDITYPSFGIIPSPISSMTIWKVPALNFWSTSLQMNIISRSKNQKLKPKSSSQFFWDQKNGKYKVISFYAKKARGLMARYLLENKIERIEDIKPFNTDGLLFRC